MTPSKDMISAERLRKIEIDGAMCMNYRLPQKAVGLWAIMRDDSWRVYLRKIRKDGLLMSSKGNNHQAIRVRIFEKIWAEYSARKADENSEKDYIEMRSNLSERKSQWVDMLLAEMKNDKVICEVFKHSTLAEIFCQIIVDTDVHREGGKLYSSISTALVVWKKRVGTFEMQICESKNLKP